MCSPQPKNWFLLIALLFLGTHRVAPSDSDTDTGTAADGGAGTPTEKYHLESPLSLSSTINLTESNITSGLEVPGQEVTLEPTLLKTVPRELGFEEECNFTYRARSPLILCSFLPDEFINCSAPFDWNRNETAQRESGHGCVKFGGLNYEQVEHANVECRALPGIECYGKRTFFRGGVPCIKYNGQKFMTTLLFSIFLGFLGIDRFCLGHTGTAVGKLLTLGGVGIWWLVDIILLVAGSLRPDDGSNWDPYY